MKKWKKWNNTKFTIGQTTDWHVIQFYYTKAFNLIRSRNVILYGDLIVAIKHFTYNEVSGLSGSEREADYCDNSDMAE